MNRRNIISLLIGVIAGIIFQCFVANFEASNTEMSLCDTVQIYDTVMVNYPRPIDSVVVTRQLVKVPIADTTFVAVVEKTTDSVTVELPISQLQYSDEDYTAWVSGFQARLDSICVYPKQTIITKKEVVKKTNKWGLGVQVGVGYTPNQVSPYVGVGVSYNILTW
jgi:hypothetical protein